MFETTNQKLRISRAFVHCFAFPQAAITWWPNMTWGTKKNSWWKGDKTIQKQIISCPQIYPALRKRSNYSTLSTHHLCHEDAVVTYLSFCQWHAGMLPLIYIDILVCEALQKAWRRNGTVDLPSGDVLHHNIYQLKALKLVKELKSLLPFWGLFTGTGHCTVNNHICLERAASSAIPVPWNELRKFMWVFHAIIDPPVITIDSWDFNHYQMAGLGHFFIPTSQWPSQ